jgi:hypothetical protein
MAVEREAGSSSLIDLLDRILDKGIVVDPWSRIALGGIDLARSRSRLVVASMDIHAKFAEEAENAWPIPHAVPARRVTAGKLAKVLPHRRPGREHGHR